MGKKKKAHERRRCGTILRSQRSSIPSTFLTRSPLGLGFSLARLPRNFAHLIVEKVALSTDSDFPCISIRFQDNTDLTFVIDPWLTFQADYSRWKDGNQKVLKRWPVVRSGGI